VRPTGYHSPTVARAALSAQYLYFYPRLNLSEPHTLKVNEWLPIIKEMDFMLCVDYEG
jgi:hypothetical protein